MRRIFTFMLLVAFSICSQAQTTFWSDNFDAPSGGANNNNAGAGWSGSSNTPGGGANTSYFGLSNSWTIGSDANACSSGNKLYIKSFGTGNVYLSDVFTDKLNATPSISTVGYTGLNLSFNWRCDGVANQDYGLVGLSSDNGSTWNWLPTKYSGQESCINASIPISSSYEGITGFKVAFRFISNATSCASCDPPFNIDNIILSGTASAGCTPPTVSAGSNVSICAGNSTTIGGSPTATGGSETGAFEYTWSPATGLSSTSVANPTANPTTTTTYTVSAHRGTLSCAATSTITVTVNTPQTLSITPVGSTTICTGGSVTLNATAGFTGYTWSTPSGTQSGASINATVAGSYSVTATGSNSCPSTSSATTITVNTPQALSITPVGSTTICTGGSVTLNATAGFTGYTWSTPSGTQSGASINATVAGSYSVTATGSNSCPSTSTATTITVNTPQALSITPVGSTTICTGGSVTLNATAGFTGYTWSTPSGTQSGASVNATTAGSYSVTATGSNSCPSTSTVTTIIVNTPQVLTITPVGSTTICTGNAVILNASAGFTNYSWTTPSGAQSGASISATEAGNYSVTATGSNGCPSTSTTTVITVGTPLPLTITPASSTTICSGGSVTLNATTGFTAYSWTTPSGVQSGASVSATAAGNYSVTATGSNGCSSTSSATTITVTTAQALSIIPVGSTTICSGNAVILNASAGFTNYSWTTPSGAQSGASISATTAGSYSVTATGSNSCPSTSTATTIIVNTPQVLTITPVGSTAICTGGSVTLNASGGFTGYSWTTPSGTQSGASVNATTAGSYSVIATGSNSCPSTSTVTTITVNAPEALNITPVGSTTICSAGSVTLNATAGFTAYSWTTPSGAQSGPSVSASAAGNYSVTATGSNGCSSSSTITTITVNTPIAISITPNGSTSICIGNSVNLDASAGFTNYTWSTPSGTQSGASISATTAGAYSVTAMGSNNCPSSSDPITISTQEAPEISISPAGPISICPNTPITLTAEEGFTDYIWSSSEQGNTLTLSTSGNYSVSATASNGCLSTSQVVDVIIFDEPSPIIVSPAGPVTICQGQSTILSASGNYTDLLWSNNDTTLSTTITSAGTYILTALNSDGCYASSNSVQVSFSTPFNINITPNGDINLCDGQSLTLQAQSGFSNYTWSNQQTGASLTVNQTGGYSVSATNSSGCLGVSGIVNVAAFLSPNASFTYNQISNYVVEFTNTSSHQGSSIWNFGGNNTSSENNPSYNFPFDGSWPVSLIVTNACGSDTLLTNVSVIKTGIASVNSTPFQIISSPTGLSIHSTTTKPEHYQLSIFDVSGKLIHSQTVAIAGNSSFFINKPAVTSGIYFLQLKSNSNQYINRISW